MGIQVALLIALHNWTVWGAVSTVSPSGGLIM